MPRVTLTAIAPLGPYPTLQPAANAMDLAMVAADATNKQQVSLDNGPILLIAQNTGVGARTITITSKVDAQNRTGDITAYSIGASELAVFKIDRTDGWRQTDGYLYFEAEHAEVKFGIVRL